MRDLDRAAIKAKGAARKQTRTNRITEGRRPRPMRELSHEDWAA